MFRMFSYAGLVIAACAQVAAAQWNPEAGQWGKEDPRDVRVMTWNVYDGLCSSNAKVEGLNNWAGLARIIAAMKPDILILQEAGDNTGNGTGSSVDSVFILGFTSGLLFDGGTDPYNGGAEITAWVQKYDPAYDLNNVFVSSNTDGFNRNVIISRYPFTDLNGDGKSKNSDLFSIIADEYAPGGDGGIRGFQFVELDLPDNLYAGDLVVANAHLKAGFSGSDHTQRHQAAQNTAYYIDYLLNGAGTGVPDPHNRISDSPQVTSILDDLTPVIFGGDWNEDELSNGHRGPADWLTRAQFNGGTDGVDRDRSDAAFDDAREPFTNSRTTRGTSKLDYLAWQDSIAVLRHAFIFDSAEVDEAAMPPELQDMDFGGMFASTLASDHLPVIADFILPQSAPPDCPADFNGDGTVGAADLAVLLGDWGSCLPEEDCPADFNDDGLVGAADLAELLGDWGSCP